LNRVGHQKKSLKHLEGANNMSWLRFGMVCDINYRRITTSTGDRQQLKEVIDLHLQKLKGSLADTSYCHALCDASRYPRTLDISRIREWLKTIESQIDHRILDEQAIANLLEKLRRI
jgi:hypothetical protein